MKKSLRILLIIIVALLSIVITYNIIIALEKSTPRDKKADIKDACNWMSNIDDNTMLNEITIPGSHDAGTRFVSLAFFSKCQNDDVYTQLTKGYRYLDMRFAINNVKDETCLTVMHGFTHCRRDFSLFSGKLSFEDTVNQCVDFLKENPTETVLFVVKKEHGTQTVSEFETLLDSHIKNFDQFFLLTDEIPTMEKARGKIVLFRRYKDEAKLASRSGIDFDWESQKGHDDVSLLSKANEKEKCIVQVQDRYEYNTKDKWNAFTQSLILAKPSSILPVCYINFLSTKGTAPYGHPYKYAKTLNKKLYTSTPKDFMGWVIVDFGSAELAKSIYSRNFIK